MNRNRRDLLQETAGIASVAMVGGLAGCLDTILGSDDGAGIESVPSGADAIVRLDVPEILDDEGVERVTTTFLSGIEEQESNYEGPTNFEAALDEIEDEYGLDPRHIEETYVFWSHFESSLGAIVNISLSIDAVIDFLEDWENSSYEEDEYEGVRIYRPDRSTAFWVGHLETDVVVVGTEGAVKAVIDVVETDASGVDSELQDAYSATDEAPVRAGALVPGPSDTEAIDEISPDGEIDYSPLDEVTTAKGTVDRDGSTRRAIATLDATNEEAAAGTVTLAEDLRTEFQAEFDPWLAQLIADIEVERSGSEVTLALEQEIDDLETVIEDAFDGGETASPEYTPIDPDAPFEFVAHEATGEDYEQTTLATADDISEISPPQHDGALGWHIAVRFSEDGAVAFSERIAGTTLFENTNSCEQDHSASDTALPKEEWGHCIAIYFEGEPVDRASLSPNLATSIADGEWAERPTLVTTYPDESSAEAVYETIRA